MKWLLLALLLLPTQLLAQTEATVDGLQPVEGPLKVGVRVAPPFVMPDGAGGYDGLAVRLWQAIAAELGVDYTLHERDISELLEQTGRGELDVAVGALTITAERERYLDFSHAWYRTGLGVASSVRSESGWWAVTRLFLSRDFLMVVAVLALVLTFWGALLWLVERKRNREQFSDRPLSGIGAGFWWAAVTMTTVGYGDKAPVTVAGRIVGLVWMFAALITVSAFTATIASSLTVGQLETRVAAASDLHRVPVAALPGTTAAEWLDGEGIAFRHYSSLPEALRALDRGEVEAVVSDEALLRYQIREHGLRRLQVLPFTLDVQDYGFAVIEAGALREPINRALLEITSGDRWPTWKRELLGE